MSNIPKMFTEAPKSSFVKIATIDKCLGEDCPSLIENRTDIIRDLGPIIGEETYIAPIQGACPSMGKCALELAEMEAANA